MSRPRMSFQDAIRLAGCTGKHRDDTRSVASRVAGRPNKRKTDRQRTEPYRCPHCRGWHIGSTTR